MPRHFPILRVEIVVGGVDNGQLEGTRAAVRAVHLDRVTNASGRGVQQAARQHDAALVIASHLYETVTQNVVYDSSMDELNNSKQAASSKQASSKRAASEQQAGSKQAANKQQAGSRKHERNISTPW